MDSFAVLFFSSSSHLRSYKLRQNRIVIPLMIINLSLTCNSKQAIFHVVIINACALMQSDHIYHI